MVSQNLSNQYQFNMTFAEILLEAFARCGIHPPALTREQMTSARRSLNLELQSLGNMGPNLWQIDLQSINLVQGVSTYQVPANTVSILDAYRETYSLPTTVNQTPSFNTIINQTQVTVNQTAHS